MSHATTNPVNAIDDIQSVRQINVAEIDAEADYGMTIPVDFQLPPGLTAQNANTVSPEDVLQWQGRLQGLDADQFSFASRAVHGGNPSTTVIPVQMQGDAEQTLGNAVLGSFINEAKMHNQSNERLLKIANTKDGLTLQSTLELQTEMTVRNNRLSLVNALVKKAGQTFQDIVKAQ